MARELESRVSSTADLGEVVPEQLATALLDAEMAGFRKTAPLVALPLAVGAALIALSAADSMNRGESSSRATTVYVSVRDGEQTAVDLPAAEATLLAALNRGSVHTGGAEEVSGEPWSEPVLIAVRRPGDPDRVFYFPWPLVTNGLPGAMRLQGGDTIRTVALPDTSLGVLNSTLPGVPFEVRGRIERPGAYETVEISEFVANASTPAYGGSFSAAADGPDVIVVSRSPSGKRLVEQYFIPIREPYADACLLESRIREGDLLEYAKMSELPIFQDRGATSGHEGEQPPG